MRKKTKALSGAAQDAYFRRVLKGHADLAAEERSRLLGQLRQDIAQVHLRVASQEAGRSPTRAPEPGKPGSQVAGHEGIAPEQPAPAAPVQAPAPFDPFSPNIIVVLRKAGRDAALAALVAIDDPDNLRLLAREQRLNVAADLSSAGELRQAIVAAAERRIANRPAAAS